MSAVPMTYSLRALLALNSMTPNTRFRFFRTGVTEISIDHRASGTAGRSVWTKESVHCTITGPCVHMRHRPSARTLQHVTVPIQNIYLQLRVNTISLQEINESGGVQNEQYGAHNGPLWQSEVHNLLCWPSQTASHPYWHIRPLKSG